MFDHSILQIFFYSAFKKSLQQLSKIKLYLYAITNEKKLKKMKILIN